MSAQQPTLPIPDPASWMTRTAAAAALGVDPATVSRWAAAGIITAYAPQRGPQEQAVLFWAAEVDDLAAARAKLGGRRTAPREHLEPENRGAYLRPNESAAA